MNQQLLFLGAVWFFVTGLFAQNSPYQSSTEFWCAPSSVKDDGKSVRTAKTDLYFLAVNDACVKIVSDYHQIDSAFFVPKDSLVVFSFFSIMDPGQLGVIDRNSFHIVSNTPILVYQKNNVLPIPLLPSLFVKYRLFESTIVSPQGYAEQYFFTHEYTVMNRIIFPIINEVVEFFYGHILSFEDDNEIQISTSLSFDSTLQAAVRTNSFDSLIEMTLNKGERIRYFITSYSEDSLNNYPKSTIISKNGKQFKFELVPMQIYYLYQINFNMPYTLTHEDFKPPWAHGTSFHVPELITQNPAIVSLFAIEDSTQVQIDGGAAIWLNSRVRLDTLVTTSTHVTSSKPLMGSMASCPCKGINSASIHSPFSVTLSHDAELIKESLFATMDMPQPDTDNQYILSVVTKTAHAARFTLNGAPVGAATFSPFPSDPNWSFANLVIPKGIHKVASDSGFHAFHYTYHPAIPNAPADSVYPSYGFVLGESNVWPADSFVNEVGRDLFNLAPFSSSPIEICTGESLFFRPSHLRHTGYEWDFGDGTTQIQNVANNRAQSISHTFQQPGNYWVVLSDTSGCVPLDSTLVVVVPSPATDFEAQVFLGCFGREVQLQYTGNGAASVSWSWPGGTANGAFVVFENNATAETLPITISVSNNTCTAIETVSIPLTTTDEELVFPNVITPNGDGINDFWCFEDARAFSACFEVQIFNRWGQQVFQSTSPATCWDPRSLPAGVYFYTTTVGVETRNGTITVIK